MASCPVALSCGLHLWSCFCGHIDLQCDIKRWSLFILFCNLVFFFCYRHVLCLWVSAPLSSFLHSGVALLECFSETRRWLLLRSCLYSGQMVQSSQNHVQPFVIFLAAFFHLDFKIDPASLLFLMGPLENRKVHLPSHSLSVISLSNQVQQVPKSFQNFFASWLVNWPDISDDIC